MLRSRYREPLKTGGIIAATIAGLSWTIGLFMEVANGGRRLSEAVLGAAEVSGAGIVLGGVVASIMIIVGWKRLKR